MTEERDPVAWWLSKLGSDNSRKSYGSNFRLWFRWLRQKEGYGKITPAELVAKQKAATNDDRYTLLDLLQEYVTGLQLAKRSMVQSYTAVRSFFAYNRADLPTDRVFRIRGKRPPAPSNMTIEIVARIINAATIRDRSLYLVKWQGLLDTAGLSYINENLGDYLAREIRAEHCPILIEVTGRKNTVNEQNYYTFIGSDAIRALKEYFEKERGWPKPGEPVWMNKFVRGLSYSSMGDDYLNLLRRLGYVPKEGNGNRIGVRYGFGIHEFRDVARTLLHVRGKSEGLDGQAVEFCMGHTSQLDPNNYDKFYRDKDYMIEQYRIAEKFLNIITNPPSDRLDQVQSQVRSQLEERDRTIAELQKTVRELAEHIGYAEDMTPAEAEQDAAYEKLLEEDHKKAKGKAGKKKATR